MKIVSDEKLVIASGNLHHEKKYFRVILSDHPDPKILKITPETLNKL